ncbi:hypothetical protein Kpol_1065p37 [Vanderwaltozyma polyspora DSM 70294]|uniref:AP-2 complex subunit alpha n=1 Tax=Vanderwaltozyma polyspora (strain ATCC 22028 / DSM 70294 / BCRC 21397 / CBS 2163 / NBRC 10782 / NRRL Y-8283 / UCD 57-17) TaxID=436907 RepID=A7TL58_VANPO|nr:uncharacterized protein Kpol_1065p37 [Vanderwaltozyma polyspora DSM 70294]EDO17021.1 hypothetical protein Kpol_1065p37 [Vanderwaltozyma polyspora DSM 70294]
MEKRLGLSNNGASNSNSNIRGLQIFIADLRSSQQSQEQERRIQAELSKIKQQFTSSRKKSDSSNKLAGYQRKKYVSKLAYIYITSNTTKLSDILFGLDEMVELLKSNVFSEKYMAYMTLEILYEHQEVVNRVDDLVTAQLVKDLAGSNDDTVALALNFIGVVGRLKNGLAYNDDVITEVFQIIRSPTAAEHLKKKAALSFLTLLKTNIDILTGDLQRQNHWIQRILSLLDDSQNYRLLLSVLPLIEFIARYVNPSQCVRLIPQLTQILYKCLIGGTSQLAETQFPAEYMFANVPNPWLITKLVSLLSVLIISRSEISENRAGLLQASNIDTDNLGKLRLCVSKAIELGTRDVSDPMERIVQNTILFSLINFASKLDPTEEALSNSATALCSLLISSETNIRYLALDSLVKLCAISEKTVIDSVCKKNLNLICRLLNNEKDQSILRKLVDLLYSFTNVDNVKIIVNHLLKFILTSRTISDNKMKRDISVKIAVLTEKYATDTNWFVEISLKLLSISSNATNNDDLIWERLSQIVVNNPQLHKITCEQLVDYLNNNNTSETIIATGAFLIGEYANLITEKISIGELFNLFTDKYFIVSNTTKCMILTTMIKLYKFAPEIGSAVIKFFQLELNSLDIELQTRSYEYLKIIQISNSIGNKALLDTLFSGMPSFNSRTNPLLRRLGNLPDSSVNNNSSLWLKVNKSEASLAGSPERRDESSSSVQNSTSPLSSMSSNNGIAPAPPLSRSRSRMNSNVTSPIKNNGINDSYYSRQNLSSNWREGFTRSISHRQGILYSSSLIKILYRITNPDIQQMSILQVSLTFINQTEWEMSGFNTETISYQLQDSPSYIIQNVESLSSTSIMPHKRIEQKFNITIRKPFEVEKSVIFNSHFKCGGSVQFLSLKIGIGMTSTLVNNVEQPGMTLPEYIGRWRQLREGLGNDGEYQLVVRPKKSGAQDLSSSLIQIMKRLGFQVVEQDSISNTVFASGIIHTKSTGNYGCLVKLKSAISSDGDSREIEITCRTTSAGSLSKYVVDCINYAL